MSSGKTHVSTTFGLTVGSALIVGYLNISQQLTPETLMIPIGVMSGVVLTPDLDHDGTVISHQYIKRSFGRVIAGWWYYLWHSYSIAFKHRSVLSHAPVLSTLIRLTFLLFPPIIIVLRDQSTQYTRLIPFSLVSLVAASPIIAAAFFIYQLEVNIILVIYFIIGLMISDLLHFLLDELL